MGGGAPFQGRPQRRRLVGNGGGTTVAVAVTFQGAWHKGRREPSRGEVWKEVGSSGVCQLARSLYEDVCWKPATPYTQHWPPCPLHPQPHFCLGVSQKSKWRPLHSVALAIALLSLHCHGQSVVSIHPSYLLHVTGSCFCIPTSLPPGFPALVSLPLGFLPLNLPSRLPSE